MFWRYIKSCWNSIMYCIFPQITVIQETKKSVILYDNRLKRICKFSTPYFNDREIFFYEKLRYADVTLPNVESAYFSTYFPYNFYISDRHKARFSTYRCILLPKIDCDLFDYQKLIQNDEKKKIEIARQMIQCVLNLHKHNLVHLDIKLENFVLYKNKVYLIDFDSMHTYDESIPTAPFTGTSHYLDPKEKAKLKKNRQIIEVSFDIDIYALLYSIVMLFTGYEYRFNNKYEMLRLLVTSDQDFNRIIYQLIDYPPN